MVTEVRVLWYHSGTTYSMFFFFLILAAKILLPIWEKNDNCKAMNSEVMILTIVGSYEINLFSDRP
jgi:uncharacterized membrane protein YqhA